MSSTTHRTATRTNIFNDSKRNVTRLDSEKKCLPFLNETPDIGSESLVASFVDVNVVEGDKEVIRR